MVDENIRDVGSKKIGRMPGKGMGLLVRKGWGYLWDWGNEVGGKEIYRGRGGDVGGKRDGDVGGKRDGDGGGKEI